LSKWKLSNFQFHGNPFQNIGPFQDPTFDSPNGGHYVVTTKDANCILKKERDEKFERAISIEKSSLATKVHF
jgi:hypothetical protein